MLFLDTDIVVDVVRRHPPAVAWLGANAGETIAVAGFTVLELLAGCRDAREQQRVERDSSRLHVFWPTAAHADIAVQNYRMLHLAHGIGTFDILIAQVAVELAVPLHTFNVKHFQHVPGLTIIQPYTR